MTCIITGCALVDPVQDRAVWGDLHIIGGCYVFNACVSGYEAAWEHQASLMNTKPSLTMISAMPHSYFERRGVIILDQTCGELNAAAKARAGG